MYDHISGWPQWADTFDPLEDINSPAELHGIITGLMVSIKPLTSEQWRILMTQLGVMHLSDAQLTMLCEEAEDVHAVIRESELDFSPLLPDDEHPIEHRAFAMAEWAGGMLFGFAWGDGVIRTGETEVLADVSEVAKLHATVDAIEGAASDPEAVEQIEEQLTDLLEFLRLAPISLAMGRKAADIATTKSWGKAQQALRQTDVDFELKDGKLQDTNPNIAQMFNPKKMS